MCGVVRTDSSTSELIVVPQESAGMPPSITLGSDPPNAASPPVEGPCQPIQALGASSNREIPTIDLATDESESDLQKAIALSLQEQEDQAPFPGISAEDREVSKALEVSLRDASPRTTISLLNPQDRRRQLNTPVGLKNIGNSCWFNVVIQPLFHIPAFRDLILQHPKLLEDDIEVEVKLQEKRLVPTLRLLFSLLVSSKRKYVDPLEAVIFFQGQEMRKNTQQDVCEFIHKLLETLEEEWKWFSRQKGIEKESSEYNTSKDADFTNPMMELFYGQSKKENCEIDQGPKLETFGQYPLTVKEYRDIHESILASMTGGLLDDNIEIIEPVQQDTWFKKLPPVLIFSLSRYEYIKEKQRAEKVHKEFDFPHCLFMDRYMESNKTLVKEKHIKISKIKQELKSLYKTLEKYQRFGSGKGKYPLADILKYVLEFAQNKAFNPEERENVIQSAMDVDNIDINEIDVEMSEIKDKIDSSISNDLSKDSIVVNVSAVEINQAGSHFSPLKKMRVLPPAPHSILPEELSVLQSCLPRWQQEVELQVEVLQKSISCLERQLQMMYEEPSLQCIPYRLHAVVVHEGQASGGHYWVYIFNNTQNTWLKFNDIQVTESNWKEVVLDSVGGQNNASAYCLMYIDQTRYEQLFPEEENLDGSFSELPIDLQEYVKDDNIGFMKELHEWELKQRDARTVPATAPNSPDILCIDEEEIGFFVEIRTMLSDSLANVFDNEQSFSETKDKSEWLREILNKDICRIKDLAEQNVADSFVGESILDFGIYIAKNDEKDLYIFWYGYELLWHLAQPHNSIVGDFVLNEVKMQLQQMRDRHYHTLGQSYLGWKRHYHTLIKCTWYFLYGYKRLISMNFETALHHLMQALVLHNQLEESFPKGPAKTLDRAILSHCFRKCLTSVNDKLIEVFIATDTEPKACDVAQMVHKLLLPSLSFIEKSKLAEDGDLAVKIREKWCQLLDLHPNVKSPLIEQIIAGVLSCPEDDKLPIIKIPNPPPVLSLYKEYRDVINTLTTMQEKSAAQTSDL